MITDAQGRSLVQATDSIPSFIATLPATIKHFLDVFPAEELQPGDVLITNDIWMGTGHLPDISVGKPIFHNGKLVGFAGSTAHAPDIGGKIRSPEPREVFEEGFQIPIMKLMRAGEADETFFRLLRQNVRAPDEVVGDLYAQLTALDLMERRVGDVMEQYNLDDLASLATEIQERSERAMRAAISELPDGTYTNEMPTDGLDIPVNLKVAITIDGDEVRADYTGSSPQVGKAINCAMCYTYAMTAYAVKCAAAPDLPNNEGSVAPISAFAPERTILNPMFPASGGSRALIGHFLPALIFGALAQVVPDRIMAGTGSPLWCINLAGVKPDGKPFANLFFFNGGMGATHRSDGQNCMSWPSNISSTPTEVIEQLSPMRIHRRGYRPGSGGNGRFRGGLGDAGGAHQTRRPRHRGWRGGRSRQARDQWRGCRSQSTAYRAEGRPADPGDTGWWWLWRSGRPRRRGCWSRYFSRLYGELSDVRYGNSRFRSGSFEDRRAERFTQDLYNGDWQSGPPGCHGG